MTKIENQFYTDMLNNRFENDGELGFWIEDKSYKVGFSWVGVEKDVEELFDFYSESKGRDFCPISECDIIKNNKFTFNSQIAFDGVFQSWEEYSTRLEKLNRLSEVTEDSFQIDCNTSEELVIDTLLGCLDRLVRREHGWMIGDDYCVITVEYFRCEDK